MTDRSMMTSVRWSSDAEVYKDLETSFDELAPSYDEDIGKNLVGIQMREAFRDVLKRALPRRGFLFEIGCGTGIDALWLAREGYEVVATDISEEMLHRLQANARAEGLEERIRCRRLAAKDVGELEKEFGPEAFAAGYSHAGAMNMEPEVGLVPAGLHRVIRPRGLFVCSVINKSSLFEVLFYPIVLHPRKAFRRLGNRVPLPISRREPLNRHVVPARFYSPRDVERMFRGTFTLASVRGVRILLPPANLTDEYARYRTAFLALEKIEDRIAAWPWFRLAGHHSILTFARA